MGATDDRSVTSVRSEENRVDSRLSDFLARAESVLARLEPLLPAVREAVDWERSLAARWHRDGRSGYLQPLEVSLDLRLADLLGVERQCEQLERNTRQFVAGQPANHALLWGARGTGKSSLVRALLAELAGAGLRLIEIERDHLADLPRVVEQLQGLPQRFVLFCDDLSFDAGEGDYRVLKSVLDGSLEQAPDNVLLYATSNRRHLVSEKQSDNENWKMVDGELHPNEAVEDKIALSDRFGLWLSFYPFTQEHFLSVVRHWVDVLAEKAGLAWSWSEELEKEAIRWALGRGNRNGRCAYQFSRYWVGKQLLERQV
nr:ATP-binding protein [Pseudomonas aeruginosa]